MSLLSVDIQALRPSMTVQAQFDVPSGMITALIGRSGAGKTTVLHAIAGLLRPSSGRIAWGGTVLFDAKQHINIATHQRGVGVVFQEGRLFPHMSVHNNLRYGERRTQQQASREGPQFDDVVNLLSLDRLLERRPHTLSGGERQRVALGRALLARPRVLLMDEPLASLDPARRQELLGYLAKLPQRFGLPVLYVTHQMDEVMRLAQRVVLMSEGRTIKQGDALEVMSDMSLQPLVGRFEAASTLAGTVLEQLHEWKLSRIEVAGQSIHVPMIEGAVGAQVWLRVRARDVAIARDVMPSSASNQLRGTVLQVMDRDEAFTAVELGLSAAAPAGQRIWALITRRSAAHLGITIGTPWIASFKAVCVEGRAISVRQ